MNNYDSFLGHNALFCANKFNVNIGEMKSAVKVRRAVERYSERKREQEQLLVACFLHELLFLRDDCLVFSNNVNFTHDELETFIFNICTT